MVLRRLGPYTVHEPLGSGGMGTVYRGVEEGTNREVAIKVLSPSLVTDSGFRDRFASEIKSLEQLSHPNIVELFGFGEHDGQLFYAMELVAGSNLQEELAAGRRFTWREVIDIGKQVCSALKHAHDHGIIHRDIKPANLVIDNDDRIRLTDFGIAKLFGNTSQTVDGGVLGTADYMSPEQAEGLNVTPRSDIYSLGAVLYALLAGRPPFQGKTLPEVVHQVRFEPPIPVRRFAPDIPEEFEEVIDTLLCKDPQNRIPTPLALSKRLNFIEESMSLSSSHDASASEPMVSNTAPWMSSEQIAAAETAMVTPDAFQENTTEHASVPIVEDASSETPSLPNRYTAVDQKYRERLHSDDESESSIWETAGKWIGLMGMIAALIWVFWYFSRPPSADKLFATIESAVDDDNELINVRDEITTFLASFPHDQRRDQIIAWQADAALAQQRRRLQSLSRKILRPEGIQPVEWMLIEALRNERSDPGKALQQFKAVTQMFAADEELTQTEQRCLRIAAQRIDAISAPTHSLGVQRQKALIAERIETARKLAVKDPQTAHIILDAVIAFCQDEPWARDLVDQARQLTSELAQRTP